jgi:hypothetical protein
MTIIETVFRLRRCMDGTNLKEIVRIPTALPTNMCAVPPWAHMPRSNKLECCWLDDERMYELVR